MRMRTTSVIVLSLLAMLAFAGCGGDEDASTGSRDPEEAPAAVDRGREDGPDPDASKERATATFEVRVRDGAVVGGPRSFRVERGDQVAITIDSDAADEAHLHGIDVTLAIPSGGAAAMEFVARDQGSYELELHEAGTLLGTVVVE